MKTDLKQTLRMLAVVLSVLTAAGCGKKSAKPATEQLQQSFEKADAAIKQEIVQANTAFQAGDYTRAITVMDRVVATQTIDAAQKQAVDALIIQTRQAAQQNPKLNTPELYKAMEDLMLRAHGEN
jgi:ABC-type glycerol-3-phosphate transport system substrate-binding protein